MYDGQGHRRNLLYPDFTAVGIGCVEYKGVKYWVQEFRKPTVSTTETAANNSATTVSVTITDNLISSDNLTVSNNNITLKTGESTAIPTVTEQITMAVSPYNTFSITQNCTWTSRDSSVASVSSGKIVATGVGSTVLTGTCSTGTVSVNVTVSAGGTSTHTHSYEIKSDSAGHWNYCAGCGNSTSKTAHSFVNQTVSSGSCTVPSTYRKVCSVCSYTDGIIYTSDTFSHSYTVVSQTAATCTKDGSSVKRCTVCGDTVTTVIPALGHIDSDNDGVCNTCNDIIDADRYNYYMKWHSTAVNVRSDTVSYNADVTIKAKGVNVPDGYVIALYKNGNFLIAGDKESVSYHVGIMGSTETFTAKIVDKNNLTVQKDINGKDLSEDFTVNVNNNIFAIIIAFFRSLFGITVTAEVGP